MNVEKEITNYNNHHNHYHRLIGSSINSTPVTPSHLTSLPDQQAHQQTSPITASGCGITITKSDSISDQEFLIKSKNNINSLSVTTGDLFQSATSEPNQQNTSFYFNHTPPLIMNTNNNIMTSNNTSNFYLQSANNNMNNKSNSYSQTSPVLNCFLNSQISESSGNNSIINLTDNKSLAHSNKSNSMHNILPVQSPPSPQLASVSPDQKIKLNNLSTSYILTTLATSKDTILTPPHPAPSSSPSSTPSTHFSYIPISPSPSTSSLNLSNLTNLTMSTNGHHTLSTSSSSGNLYSSPIPTSSSPYNIETDSIDDDYEFLKDGWKKIRDFSTELAKLSKIASKQDLQSVDLMPNLQKEFENISSLLNKMYDKYNYMKSDDRQEKKRKESDKNAEKRKKRREATMLQNNVCRACKTTDTPEWRKGPDGTKSLCNACGLHFAKIIKKEASQAMPQISVEQKESMKLNSILN